MTIPPIHNCIVQWTDDPEQDDRLYLNVFVTDSDPYFYELNSEFTPDTKRHASYNSYEAYITDVLNVLCDPPYLYIPTIATTAKEARALHPELFI